MVISKETLKGYVLEEILAYLIRNAGYRLLVDQSEDPSSLRQKGNGLVVDGRGSEHQVDVLGQLEWVPAFTFPLRLFVEAKFRSEKTGIGVVRNAIGIVLDINQNINRTLGQTPPPPKYQYEYAIFSTSGFSGPAMDMALAHQISLVDLSGEEYRELRESIDQSCGQLIINDGENTGEADSRDDIDHDEQSSRPRMVALIRDQIRRELGTAYSSIHAYDPALSTRIGDAIRGAIAAAMSYGQLFVGMANGPYMLLLKADDPTEFMEFSKAHPRHDVKITWSTTIDGGRTWEIIPSSDQTAYRLTFRLPQAFYNWIFKTMEGCVRRAYQTKATYFRTISIYHRYEEQDRLIKLEIDPHFLATLLGPSAPTELN